MLYLKNSHPSIFQGSKFREKSYSHPKIANFEESIGFRQPYNNEIEAIKENVIYYYIILFILF